ncbi:hypothetical protein Tco_1014185, partial [Tanacetum coccineum]
MLNSREFIPLMTPTQALKSIQIMAEHSHDWYDETTTRERINDRSDNINAIQASSKEAHLTKEYPLKKDKEVEQSKYVGSLEETIIKFCEESIKKQAAKDEWIRKFIENTDSNTRTTKGNENMKEPVPHDLPVVQTYVPLAQFLGNPYRTRKTIYVIGIPEEIKKDEGDMNDGYDIMVEDVERLRKILTPPIHALPNLKPIVQPYMPLGLVCNKAKVVREEEPDYDHVMQPLTPQTVHITPP